MIRSMLFLLSVLPIFVKAEVTARITPRGYNASLNPGASFTFQCDVTGAEGIQWIVDGVPSARQDIRNRGISESAVIPTTVTGSYKANITLARNIANRNTTILCIAVHMIISSAGVPSESVLFKIQGLLDAPSNLMLSETDNQCMRKLSWDKPFSLDITDIDPDISHYKVCYSPVNSNKSQCVLVNKTEFTFLNVDVPLLFTVSAVNVVGEGNISSILHDGNDCANTTGLIILHEYINLMIISKLLQKSHQLVESQDLLHKMLDQ